jgi:hypothetical protein
MQQSPLFVPQDLENKELQSVCICLVIVQHLEQRTWHMDEIKIATDTELTVRPFIHSCAVAQQFSNANIIILPADYPCFLSSKTA